MANTDQFSCLLVDDDVGFTSMMAKIVTEEGGSPVACHTVSAARSQIAQSKFDLVILDNGLPDGSGYDFYSHLVRNSPASVVAMVTGAPELSQAVELTRNGLFDYLTKPLDSSAFAALLREMGFQVTLLSARVGSAGPEFDHLTLRVDLEHEALPRLVKARRRSGEREDRAVPEKPERAERDRRPAEPDEARGHV